MKSTHMKISLIDLIKLWLGYRVTYLLEKKDIQLYPDWMKNFKDRKAVNELVNKN